VAAQLRPPWDIDKIIVLENATVGLQDLTRLEVDKELLTIARDQHGKVADIRMFQDSLHHESHG
jgi:hypothetical protein